MDGVERGDERPETFEIGEPGGRVAAPVDVVGRPQLGNIGVDEVRLAPQVGAELQEFIQLRKQELPVDLELPEAAAVGVGEVVGDELGEAGVVGPLQAGEQVPPLVRGEFPRQQQVEGGVLEALDGAVRVVPKGEVGEPGRGRATWGRGRSAAWRRGRIPRAGGRTAGSGGRGSGRAPAAARGRRAGAPGGSRSRSPAACARPARPRRRACGRPAPTVPSAGSASSDRSSSRRCRG